LLAAGAGFLAWAAWALWTIPRGPRDFVYAGYTTAYDPFLPLPFAAMNGFTPEQLSSHLARLLLLAPACALLGLAAGPWLARLRLQSPRRLLLISAAVVAVLAIATFVIR